MIYKDENNIRMWLRQQSWWRKGRSPIPGKQLYDYRS